MLRVSDSGHTEVHFFLPYGVAMLSRQQVIEVQSCSSGANVFVLLPWISADPKKGSTRITKQKNKDPAP